MALHRDQIIRTAADAARLPETLSKLLLVEAPWLDGAEEVSGEIAVDLLAADAERFGVEQQSVEAFVSRYNALVRKAADPQVEKRSEAYVAVAEALAPFGREDAFGSGDYWIISDSFSTPTPVIQLLGTYRFPPEAQAALRAVLKAFSGVVQELRIVNEEGDVVSIVQSQ